MIKDGDRFFCLDGAIAMLSGPSTRHITDWDCRRGISVIMDGFQDDEQEATQHYTHCGNKLLLDVYHIHLSTNSEIISQSSNPDGDHTQHIHYPTITEAALPDDIQTLRLFRD